MMHGPQNGACPGAVASRGMPWTRGGQLRAPSRAPAVPIMTALLALVAVTGGQAAQARRRYGAVPPGVPDIDVVVRPSGVESPGGGAVEMAVFGDSSVAGVGVHDVDEALPVQVAQRVADALGRPVHVVGYGVSGARTRDVLDQQVPGVHQVPDVSVLVVGTNDVTHVASPAALAATTSELYSLLTAGGAPLVVSSLPEFRAMRVLPNPLMAAARGYAGLVRTVQRRAAARNDLVHLVDVRRAVGHEFIGGGTNMSPDLFHPSAAGYGRIADALVPTVLTALTTTQRAGVLS